MIVWIDEHLSRRLAPWLKAEFGLEAAHVSELGLSSVLDSEIFARGRTADAVILTKDFDFVALLDRLGPPPRVIWLTCANASTPFLKRLLALRMPIVLESLAAGEALVEIA